ncbi:MAG: hypothetical protein MRK02_07155 [Candidatus Scalindua sp.]|nr:hypothetical protein [Candidatus Scalindua sp.]
MDSGKEEKKITKIIILAKGKETKQLRVTARESEPREGETTESKRPEPFKFEFDLSEYMEGGN